MLGKGCSFAFGARHRMERGERRGERGEGREERGEGEGEGEEICTLECLRLAPIRVELTAPLGKGEQEGPKELKLRRGPLNEEERPSAQRRLKSRSEDELGSSLC